MKRRSPKQQRAKETIDVIVRAATQILSKHGAKALNTNAIAERAGVSIGTVYEYFPNKQAILVAMAREQLGRDQSLMLETILIRDDESLEAMATRVVKALIALHAREVHVRRAAMGEHLAQGHTAEHTIVVSLVAEQLDGLDRHLTRPLSETARFVLSRGVLGVVHAALREEPSLLGSAEFEAELISLAVQFLRAAAKN